MDKQISPQIEKTNMLWKLAYYYIYFSHFTYIPLHSLYLVTSTWSREHIKYSSLDQVGSSLPPLQSTYTCLCSLPFPVSFMVRGGGSLSFPPTCLSLCIPSHSQNVRGCWGGGIHTPQPLPFYFWDG